MTLFDLKDKVRIKQNGREGIVRAIWHSVAGDTQYSVRYADANGLVVNNWFVESDIEVATVSPPTA